MSDATPQQEAADRRRARRVAWIVRLGGLVLRVLALTWRVRVLHPEHFRDLRARGAPLIFSLWHGQMLPLLWQHRNEGVAILISEHRDGEIIARVAESLGFRTIRGSTSRGASRALLGLIRELEAGAEVAITPDGPRGPAGSYAPGALVAAHRAGAAIVTVGVAVDRAWYLKSWDRFLIPKPFSRLTVAYGAPAFVAASTPREAVEESSRFQRLMEATVADAHG